VTSVPRAPAGTPATTQQAHPQRKRSAVAEEVHGRGEAELISALYAAAAPLLAHGDRPRRGAGRAPPRRNRDPHVPSRRGAPVHETLEEARRPLGAPPAHVRGVRDAPSAGRAMTRRSAGPRSTATRSSAPTSRTGSARATGAGSACSASGARRRRGIAEALLTTAFGEFFRRGEWCVALNVDAESPPARRGCMRRSGCALSPRRRLQE
jgi:hypothetical protein